LKIYSKTLTEPVWEMMLSIQVIQLEISKQDWRTSF